MVQTHGRTYIITLLHTWLIYSNIQEFDDNLDGFYKLTNVKVLFQKNPPGKQIMPLDVLESTSTSY